MTDDRKGLNTSPDEYNNDGTRKDSKLADDYAGMGDCIKVINEIISSGRYATKTPSYRQACVDRNVSHLEHMKAMTDWGSEDMTATTNAITAGKGYTAS